MPSNLDIHPAVNAIYDELTGSVTPSNLDVRPGLNAILDIIAANTGVPTVTIQDDGVDVTPYRNKINFIGSSIVDNPTNGTTDITIDSGLGSLPLVQIDQSGGASDSYGSITGLVNGVNTDYTISAGFYTTGKLKVYLNGQLQTQGTTEDWVELVPNSGTFRFNVAPQTGALITAEYDKIAVSGNGITYVRTKADLPTATAGVITLNSGNYVFTGDVDLTGDRIVCNGAVAIFGVSSETSYIRSTGLTGANPLIYTEYTIPMQNISITAPYAIHVNGDGIRDVAVDWLAVNFVDCARVGIVDSATNFVYKFSAFLNSSDLEFTGTIGTIAIENSLLNGQAASTILKLPATLTVTRRFRIIYSSIISLAGETSINVNVGATIPTEGYILDTVNFSGGGTYLAGVDQTSNLTRFNNNTGITNTSVNGQMYMQNNATATIISNTTDFFKVAGITTASVDNQKYSHSNNRLTNNATISRKFLIQASVSFTSGNNNVCEFGFYDSELATIRTPSRTKSTANGAGRAENVTFMCVVEHKSSDYIEVHARNISSATNITVTDMNVLITEIN